MLNDAKLATIQEHLDDWYAPHMRIEDNVAAACVLACDVPDLMAEVQRLRDLVFAVQERSEWLEGALREVQWYQGICPSCGECQRTGHASDCALADALRGEEAVA